MQTGEAHKLSSGEKVAEKHNGEGKKRKRRAWKYHRWLGDTTVTNQYLKWLENDKRCIRERTARPDDTKRRARTAAASCRAEPLVKTCGTFKINCFTIVWKDTAENGSTNVSRRMQCVHELIVGDGDPRNSSHPGQKITLSENVLRTVSTSVLRPLSNILCTVPTIYCVYRGGRRWEMEDPWQ